MEFKRYPKVRRLGEEDTQGIEAGRCVVFPKIDGTNAQVYLKGGRVQGASRNRELTLDNDNQGFYNWLIEQDNIEAFLHDHP